MIEEPKCFIRKCKYYRGVKWFGNTEATENHFCDAFPDGIPTEITYGNNPHSSPLSEQKNDIVYEREDEER